MITFCVITCTYNAASVLQPTLDSVARQTYGAVEHLIIDGASTDDTLPMVERYREHCTSEGSRHRVIVNSEPDKGLYDAMNKALHHATGDYLVFLNAGDSLPAIDTLERMAECVEEPMAGVLYGETRIVDEQRRYVGPRHLLAPKTLTWRSFRQGMLVCHQAFYPRTDLARGIAYDRRYRFSADFDWCIRVMKECERKQLPIVNTGLVVADFLQGGMTTQNHRASLLERFRVMCRHYGVFTTVCMHLWFVIRGVKATLGLNSPCS